MADTDPPPPVELPNEWFPLIPRPRPPGLPLRERIAELRDLATQPGDDATGLVRAAEVFNKAALIASDCGLPHLATGLCWRQHAIFARARPLPGAAAKLAVQPLLNLPRQLIRQGDGEAAHALLETLHRAARDHTETVVDGHTVNLHDLTRTPEDHHTVRTLVWAALLADGVRALVTAGRWHDAARHAATHRGVGTRLLDGRQITILALVHDGRPDQATNLVEQSTVAEPWEHAVHGLLRVLCRRAAAHESTADLTTTLAAVRTLLEQQPDPSTAVFRTRVALTALSLADTHEHHPRPPHLRALMIATASRDAYAARDVLAHPPSRRATTDGQHRLLTETVRASGLDAKAIPEPLRRDLNRALSSAEDRMRALLPDGAPPRQPHRT